MVLLFTLLTYSFLLPSALCPLPSPDKIGRFQNTELPAKVDLQKYMTEVEEQVDNSCVANTFVGAYEYLAKHDLGDSADVSRLYKIR